MKKIIILSLVFNSLIFAQNYWVGGSQSNLWSTESNWSLGRLPQPNETVIFSGSISNSNCTVDIPVNLDNFYINNNYSGTIQQGQRAKIVVSGDFIQEAGQFICSKYGMNIKFGKFNVFSNAKFIQNRGFINASNYTVNTIPNARLEGLITLRSCATQIGDDCNLLVNGDFEEYTGIPKIRFDTIYFNQHDYIVESMGTIDYTCKWQDGLGVSDYFLNVEGSEVIPTPGNPALSGSLGSIYLINRTWSAYRNPNGDYITDNDGKIQYIYLPYREIPWQRLDQSMVPGKKYLVRFYTMPGIESPQYFPYLGFKFTSIELKNIHTTSGIEPGAYVDNRIINSPGTWTKISAIYTADGTEQYFNFGYFGPGDIDNSKLEKAYDISAFTTPPHLNTGYFYDNISITKLPDNISNNINITICEGQSTNLIANLGTLTCPLLQNISYKWKIKSGSDYTSDAGIGTTINVTPIINTTYGFFIDDALYSEVNVTVVQKPNVTILTNAPTYCSQQNINFSSTLVSGASYNWSGPNFSSSNQNPTATAPNQSNPIYTLTLTKDGCIFNYTKTLSVNTVRISPIPSITGSTCSLYSEGDRTWYIGNPSSFPIGTTYRWKFDNTFVPGYDGLDHLTINPSVNDGGPPASSPTQCHDVSLVAFVNGCQYSNQGNFATAFTNTSCPVNCQKGTHRIKADSISGTSEQYSIYPNPSNGTFTFSKNATGFVNIEIYNVLGQKIFFINEINSTNTEINFSDKSIGIYQLKINKIGESPKFIKLVIQ